MKKTKSHAAYRQLGDRPGYFRPLCGQLGKHVTITQQLSAATCAKCRRLLQAGER